MGYKSQNFYSGQKLTDENMKHIEAGIASAWDTADDALEAAQNAMEIALHLRAEKADNWEIDEETGLAYLTANSQKISSGIPLSGGTGGGGGGGGGGTPYAVQYVFQKLTETQQEQARKNIGINNLGSAEQIDIKKYGITEGNIDHKAPYSTAEWEQAYNNFEGIKAALAEMAANGQTSIMLPKGTYVVCYQNPNGGEFYANYGWEIVIPSHVTFDLNGSTIRVIFDSDNRCPYDKSTLEPYKLNGSVFAFSQSYHSTIRNGILLGDRYERAYAVDAEKNQEQTYGIKFTNGSEHCAVLNMEISGFMGDAITGDGNHDPDKGGVVVSGTQTYTNLLLDASGAEKTGVADSFVSGYHDLTPITSVGGKVMTVRTNLGYVREYNEGNKFSVFFYDTNKTFLSTSDYEQLDNITIPANAVYCRLMTRSATAAAASAKTLDVTYQITPPPAQFTTVEDCKIYNNNRGGMSNLPNDITIRKCELYENGTAGTNGWPLFGDSTRYAINCEDTVCRKISILDNYFHDGTTHCMLMSAKNCVVDGNKIQNFGISVGGYSFVASHYQSVVFTNNMVENAATPNVDSRITNVDGRHMIVANNIFRNCTLRCGDGVELGKNVLRTDRISAVNNGKNAVEGVTLIEDKGIATAYLESDVSGVWKDCKFTMRQKMPYGGVDRLNIAEGTENLVIEYTGDASKRQYRPTSIYGTKIIGGEFRPNSAAASWGTGVIEDSTLEPGSYVNLPVKNDFTFSYTFKRSNIVIGKNFDISQFFYLTRGSVTNGLGVELVFEDCVIDVYKGTQFIQMAYGSFDNIANRSFKYTFKNCTFNNHTTGTVQVINTTNATGLDADSFIVTWENNTMNGNWTAPV